MARLATPNRSAKETLLLWLRQQRDLGFTLKQIAATIDPDLQIRTVEYWAQERSLPREWMCALILHKLGIPFRR